MKSLLFITSLMFAVLWFSSVHAGLAISNMYPQKDYIYVMVEYENDTAQTYQIMTIKCDALDRNENVIGSNQKSISPPNEDQIKPGYKTSTRIAIQISDQKANSVSCNSNLN